MSDLRSAAESFLACGRIAVVGVSRDPQQAANAIYRKLRESGRAVFAVNPRTDRVEGDPCYPDIESIPGGVDAVFIATPASEALRIVRACRTLSVGRVWMHRGIGRGSVSGEAVEYCRANGIRVIAGACPMMFCAPVDPFHRCMRAVLSWFGGLPKGD